jgi:hypothetical protein
MVMESFDKIFEDFISLCIIGCKIVHISSHSLMISLKVVDQGLTRHDS